MEQVHQLAQLGITVEIIGHELEDLDFEMLAQLRPVTAQRAEDRGLSAGPRSAAHPEQSATIPQSAEPLGRLPMLFDHWRGHLPLRCPVLSATARGPAHHSRRDACFHSAVRLTEYFHRVVPVFDQSDKQRVLLAHVRRRPSDTSDEIDDSVIVADTGPGVDPDDVERLFELFFTRRAEGRLVGLDLLPGEPGSRRTQYQLCRGTPAPDSRWRQLRSSLSGDGSMTENKSLMHFSAGPTSNLSVPC